MIRFCFDVDGVVLDFEKLYIQSMRTYFQLDIQDDYETSSWDFSEILSEDQLMEGWNHFVDGDYFAQLEPLVSSKRFNDAFGAYPVHFITNIPPQCLELREQNLESAGFKWESLHCGGLMSHTDAPPMTKSTVIKGLANEGDSILFVDDHPGNCEDVLENIPGSKICLMTRKFNEDFEHPEIHRANNWDELIQFSEELIQNE